MFDELDRDQLSALHELLYFVCQGIYAQLFDADSEPRMPTDSIEWMGLRVRQDQATSIMSATFAEMQRRDQKAVEDA